MSDAVAKRFYLEGVTALKEEKFSVAELRFREAVTIKPDYAEALRDLGWLLYGMFRKSEEALLYLEKARSLDDSLDYLHMYLGVVLGGLKRGTEAEASFQKALLDPSYPALVHAVFADYLAWNHKNEEAEAHFVSAIAMDSDLTVAHRNYARFLASAERNDDAEKHFAKALELDPEDKLTKRHYEEFSQYRAE